MTDEGYLLLATGSAKYLGTAQNPAASLRIRDGTRPICLVHDDTVWLDAAGARHLDASAVLTDDPPYPGFMDKTYLFPTSPYRRTTSLDADCLLPKRDIDSCWSMMQPHLFAITGDRRAHRKWKGADVARLLRQEDAPYLVQINSSVFWFDNGPEAERFSAWSDDFDMEPQHGLSRQYTIRWS